MSADCIPSAPPASPPGRIIVAMSGGVDSTVAASLLRAEGWEVIGATFDLWPGGENETVAAAQQAAAQIGIPHRVISLRDEFLETIVAPFCREYFDGRTPNPCVRCNPLIKFNALIRLADELGAQAVATGHYARVEWSDARGRHLLRRATDPQKDQSYVLCRLEQRHLSRVRFPLGALSKQAVRELALKERLACHNRPDSQEICFVPGDDYAGFLESRMPERVRPGDIRDSAGRLLGRHEGIHRFTIGQRKGLRFAAGEPRFVLRLDAETATVIVGPREETMRSAFAVQDVNWIYPVTDGQRFEAEVKIRYRHRGVAADIQALPGGGARVSLHAPESAVTPGQAAVFYDGEYVIGGGTICA